MKYLEKIQNINNLKTLSLGELNCLSDEIRDCFYAIKPKCL